MTNENETVEQVREEMRGVKNGQHANGGRLYERYLMKCQIAEEYADRIDAAHTREIAAKDAEIERLRAALKPVLEVEYFGLELDFMCSSADAVREAQRVYKESEVE